MDFSFEIRIRCDACHNSSVQKELASFESCASVDGPSLIVVGLCIDKFFFQAINCGQIFLKLHIILNVKYIFFK